MNVWMFWQHFSHLLKRFLPPLGIPTPSVDQQRANGFKTEQAAAAQWAFDSGRERKTVKDREREREKEVEAAARGTTGQRDSARVTTSYTRLIKETWCKHQTWLDLHLSYINLIVFFLIHFPSPTATKAAWPPRQVTRALHWHLWTF